MIQKKILWVYTNLFSPNDYQKNEKIICKHVQYKHGQQKNKSWISTKINRCNKNYLLGEVNYKIRNKKRNRL